MLPNNHCFKLGVHHDTNSVILTSHNSFNLVYISTTEQSLTYTFRCKIFIALNWKFPKTQNNQTDWDIFTKFKYIIEPTVIQNSKFKLQ